MPDGFDIDGARKAGATDQQILGYLTSSRSFDVAGAKKAGASDADIIKYLATNPKKAGSSAPAAPAGPDRSVMPPIGQRIAPPGTKLRSEQNKVIPTLPPNERPGSRIIKDVKDEAVGALPLAGAAAATALAGPEAGWAVETGLSALGAGAGSLAKQGEQKLEGRDLGGSSNVVATTAIDTAMGALLPTGNRLLGVAEKGIAKTIDWGLEKTGLSDEAHAFTDWFTKKKAAMGLDTTKKPVDIVPKANEVFRPGKADSGFNDNIERATPLVKAAATRGGSSVEIKARQSATDAAKDFPSRPGEYTRDLINHTVDAEQATYERFRSALGPYDKFESPGSVISKKVKSLITPEMRSDPADAEMVKGIEAAAEEFDGEKFTALDARKQAAKYNARLMKYYRAPDDAARASALGGKSEETTRAIADGFREASYKPFRDAVSLAQSLSKLARTDTEKTAAATRLQAATERLSQAQEAMKDYGALSSFRIYLEDVRNEAGRDIPKTAGEKAVTLGHAAGELKSGNVKGAMGSAKRLSDKDIDGALREIMEHTDAAFPETRLEVPYGQIPESRRLSAPGIQMPGLGTHEVESGARPQPSDLSGDLPGTYRDQASTHAKPFETITVPTKIRVVTEPPPGSKSAKDSAGVFSSAPGDTLSSRAGESGTRLAASTDPNPGSASQLPEGAQGRQQPLSLPQGKSAQESADVFRRAGKTYTELFDKADRRYAKRPIVPREGTPEFTARVQDARERMATDLKGKPWQELNNEDREIIDQLAREGYGFSVRTARPPGVPGK